MAQIKKQKLPKNLDSIEVFIEDSYQSSRYFKIINFPNILHCGKNHFLIAGSEYLEEGTSVFVEIKDSRGNIIYHEVSDILVGAEFRLISIFVYSTTPIGDATITIVGCAKTMYSEFGNIPIPDVWRNRYNIRWSKKIMVDTLLGDSSTAIFKEMPEIQISEIYDVSRSIDFIDSIIYLSGSGILSGASGYGFGVNSPYYITIPYDGFVSDMVGGIITIPNPKVRGIPTASGITSRITNVENSKKMQISPGYTFAVMLNRSGLQQAPVAFTGSNFTMSYSIKVPNTGSINKINSYLNVNISKIDTYSGTVRYVDLYKNPGNVFIGRYSVTPNEKIISGSIFKTKQEFVSSWKIYSGSQSDIQFDSGSLLNSIKSSGL